MAESYPAEKGFVGEAIKFTGKALGNTALFLYAVHVVREWKGPAAGFISRQLESRRQNHDEEQSVEYIEEQ